MAEEKAEGREPHPAIRAAMKHLQEEKNILQNRAAKDFGGHKVQAVKTARRVSRRSKPRLNNTTHQRPSGFVEGRSHRARQSLSMLSTEPLAPADSFSGNAGTRPTL